MTTSRVPAAIDALVSTLRASLGSGATVVDGPPLDWDDLTLPESQTAAYTNRLKYLFVGAGPDSDTAASGGQDFNAAGAVSRDETFAIECVVYVRSGNDDIKARRDEAFTLLAAAETALRTDPSLGGAVLYSRVAALSDVLQRQTRQGSDCVISFTVACRAYLS